MLFLLHLARNFLYPKVWSSVLFDTKVLKSVLQPAWLAPLRHNNNNNNSYIALCPKMSSRRWTASKSTQGQFVQKIQRNKFLKHYVINDQKETALDRLGHKMLNSSIPNHTQWEKKKVKQYSFTRPTNIQTIQLTLTNTHTQDET